ncbi:DUF6153 family protein [Streptomyces werraensis]|uniref:DUF6153 family protein n=1 Tax=Streptomyces werraensis TaxID=68284 RepID=UPI0033BF2FE6
MTVREFPWLQASGAVRWVRGMLVTLCAVLAVLAHHELSDTSFASTPARAAHAMPRSAPMSALHTHTRSPGHATGTGSSETSCSSMVMQHCSTADVSTVQLVAPPESPIPPSPTLYATVSGVNIARSVSRAPPDLSLLSQLRI